MQFVNRTIAATITALAAALIGAPAHADHRPVIAVPGNAQVPVIMDGVDATDAVIIGDWGLYAPGRIAPKIIAPAPVLQPPPGAWYPATGHRPRYGRQEVEPIRHRRSPTGPQDFNRSWTSESGRGPVTEYPPFEPPPVTVEPRRRRY